MSAPTAAETVTVLPRKNGTVTVTETAAGWRIVGEGGRSTFRMNLPRCKPCAEWTPRVGAYRPVCSTLHRGGMYGSTAGMPMLTAAGAVDHARKTCHGNHAERVAKVVELIAKTYGRAA